MIQLTPREDKIRNRRVFEVSREDKKSPTFKSWQRMIIKSEEKLSKKRGQTKIDREYVVCERWLSFQYFREDMGEKPEGLWLDRLDRYAPFSRDNCQWVERGKLNKRGDATRYYLGYGKTEKTITEWARELNVPTSTLRYKAKKGTLRKYIISRHLETKAQARLDQA